MIIPFFIPHSGCPHQCVFCNQKRITGKSRQPDPESISGKIRHYLNTRKDRKPVQVAFYGGTFTALPLETQEAYLEAVGPFITSEQIENIRISTRPDYINPEILSFLKNYHVTIVELGAQSMDDNVLTLAGRGHTAADTINSVKLLRDYGLTIGLQLMPGLPGDSAGGFMEKTVHPTIAFKPDFVRLYPALVIKETPLETLYASGQYSPLSLDDAVSLCGKARVRFEQAGIAVIRIGLQPTVELERPGAVVAGPYHPAFRQLVESSIFLERMKAILRDGKKEGASTTFYVNSSDISTAVGQGRSNLALLKREFKLPDIRVLPDKNVRRGEIRAAIHQ